MASLSGNSINTTYESLVKFTDNAAVTGTLKALTDGAGNTLPLEVSSTGVNFTGTVTGIPSGGSPAFSLVPTTEISFTGPSSNDTIIGSVLIPGGSFASGDVLEVTAAQHMDFTAGGWIYSSLWIYTDATTVYGGESIGQIQTPSGQDGLYKKTLYINGSTTAFRSYSLAQDYTQQVYSGDPWYTTTAINWAVDQYINFHTWVDNAGTYIYVPAISIKKIN